MSENAAPSPGGFVHAKISATPGPLQSLGREKVHHLASIGRLVRADIGRLILAPKQIPESAFIILEGRVRVLGVSAQNSPPELLETLGPGGVVGLSSILAGVPLEAAMVSESVLCLQVSTHAFLEFLEQQGELLKTLRHEIRRPELFGLLAADFSKNAMDLSQAGPLAKSQIGSAKLLNGTAPADSPEDFVWWNATPEQWGNRWLPDHGAVRRIGLPKSAFPFANESSQVPRPSPSDKITPAAALKSAEPPTDNIPEPQLPYPVITAKSAGVEEVVSCFEMLAIFHKKTFPKETIRRVLQNEARQSRAPSLHTCGTVAAMAGFAAQLVRIPSQNLPQLETPALLNIDDSICVVYEFTSRTACFAHPLKGLQRVPVGEFLARFPAETDILLARPLPSMGTEKFGFRWFLPEIRKHKRALVEVFVSSLFIQFFGLANPMLTQMIIDKVLVQNSISALHVLGVIFIIIALADTCLTALRTYLFVDTTNRIDLALGARIIDHLYKLKLSYFQRRPVGEVSARLHEIENIRQFLTGTALTVGLDAIFSVVFMAMMLFYSLTLSFVALLVVPLLAGVTLLGAPILRRQILRRSEEGARTQSHLIETITGVQTVKAGNMEQQSRWEWQKRNAGFVSAGFQALLTAIAMNSTGTIISRLGDLAILWYGSAQVIEGNLTLGQLIAFRIIAGNVTSPLIRLAQSWQNFQEVALSVERLGDLMNSPAEQTLEQSVNIPLPPIQGKVEFDSITFAYIPGQQPQLRNVSFTIPAGSFVGVVGRSGSGKSTVLKLLPRLYTPDTGRILIDNYEIAKVELYSLRRQIGTVLQDSLLFNGSVFANIAVSDPDATPDDVMRAARIAGAHDFIMSLPEGYNTNVGEQGRALSGGQRQRVAIARTVLLKPRLLILDEATSALDSPSEHLVCKNLAEEFRGNTVFFVTHRVRSIEHADHILVLDRGILVEQGTHEELMKLKSVYHSLYTGAENPT